MCTANLCSCACASITCAGEWLCALSIQHAQAGLSAYFLILEKILGGMDL